MAKRASSKKSENAEIAGRRRLRDRRPLWGRTPPSGIPESRRPNEAILIVGSLFLLVFLVYTIQPVLSPFLILGAILFLLYPLRGLPIVRTIMWLSFSLFLIWFFNELSGLLIPFVIAYLLAYLLNPVVEFFERKKVPRWVTTLGLMLIIVGAGVAVLLFVLPIAFGQFDDMLQWVTSMVKEIADVVREGRLVAVLQGYGLPVERIQQILNEQFTPRLEDIMRGLIEGVLGFIAGISTIVTRIINAIIIPFLAFYLLKDFPLLRNRFNSSIPPRNRESVLRSVGKVDALLGRYLRGALAVAVINGILVSLLLWAFGIDYPLVLGMIAGILNLIPYFGLLISLVLSILVASFSGEPAFVKVVYVVITFGVVQILEAAVLSPRIVGGQVGLHPVLLILSLLVFSFFLGFIGLLIAVPTTAVIVMFVREYQARVQARQLVTDEARQGV